MTDEVMWVRHDSVDRDAECYRAGGLLLVVEPARVAGFGRHSRWCWQVLVFDDDGSMTLADGEANGRTPAKVHAMLWARDFAAAIQEAVT